MRSGKDSNVLSCAFFTVQYYLFAQLTTLPQSLAHRLNTVEDAYAFKLKEEGEAEAKTGNDEL